MRKAERLHLDRVAQLGCICCRNSYGSYSPASIHHVRAGVGMSQRSTPSRVLPLCPLHHQHGGHGTAIHAGKRTWETRYGTEEELLEQVNQLLGEYHE